MAGRLSADAYGDCSVSESAVDSFTRADALSISTEELQLLIPPIDVPEVDQPLPNDPRAIWCTVSYGLDRFTQSSLPRGQLLGVNDVLGPC